MHTTIVKLNITVLVAVIVLWSSQAWSIAINQYSAFINSPDIGLVSLEDTQVGSGFNEFQGAGLGVAFTNNLGANDLGSVTWEITNNSGGDLTNTWFFGFLDVEIDEHSNSYFNESGALVSVDGTGSGDTAADAWEIDEPGFVFGDIYDNLSTGSLDNTNNVPAGFEDDVSLALGFNIDTLFSGQSLLATFNISLSNIDGLIHTDSDSNTTFYFNGNVDVQDILSVPEPGTLMVFVIGLVGLLTMKKASPCLI